jgi:hypothetical protein
VAEWYQDGGSEVAWFYAIRPGVVPSYCSLKSVCPSKRACSYPQALLDANWPTFAMAGVKKRAAAKRTVTFVGGAGPATFTYTLEQPDGVTLSVKAGKGGALSFSAPGDTGEYKLRAEVNKGAAAGWAFGAITWADGAGKWSVRSPVAVVGK